MEMEYDLIPLRYTGCKVCFINYMEPSEIQDTTYIYIMHLYKYAIIFFLLQPLVFGLVWVFFFKIGRAQ